MSGTSAPSRKGLSKIACNRLQKELVEWQVNPPSGFNHKVTDNLQRWVIEVNGAPGTLYSNETFQLQVDFPEHYPMESPQVIFLAPAPLHPHIYSNGHICLGTRRGHPCPNLDIKSKEQKRRVKEKSKGQDTSLVFDPVELPVDLHSVDHRKSLSLSRLSTSIHDLDLNLDSPRLSTSIHILYDSWSPAMTVSSICISILSMLSSSTVKQRPTDNDRYVKNCRKSPKETRWWFHDDKV